MLSVISSLVSVVIQLHSNSFARYGTVFVEMCLDVWLYWFLSIFWLNINFLLVSSILSCLLSVVTSLCCHEHYFVILSLSNIIDYCWCQHALQSSWGTYSSVFNMCRTKHAVLTIFCHQSETLRFNLEKRDFLRIL